MDLTTKFPKPEVFRGVHLREPIAEFLLRLRTIGLTDHRLLSAVEATPRQNFVPLSFTDIAYSKGPFPIECGQTMTGADEVVRIVHALNPLKTSKVLELGTGSGYQTALISVLARKVITLERYHRLTDQARLRFARLHMGNIKVNRTDVCGTFFGSFHYDRIVSNCSFAKNPTEFIHQLTSEGIMIAPVGAPNEEQNLMKYTKVNGQIKEEVLFPVRFQPFQSGTSRVL